MGKKNKRYVPKKQKIVNLRGGKSRSITHRPKRIRKRVYSRKRQIQTGNRSFHLDHDNKSIMRDNYSVSSLLSIDYFYQ